MQYKVVITATARLETLVAYDYYENVQEGLGEIFLAALIERYNAIGRNPQYFSFIDDRRAIRDVVLAKFPFLIIFQEVGETVFILSVFNTHRNPELR